MTDTTYIRFVRVKLTILSLILFQYCALPKYIGDADFYYNTIDQKINGVKEGFWNRYLDVNFKPTKNENKVKFIERIYYRNGEKLNSDYKLSKGLQRRQLVTPINVDHLDQPILLEGTYKFLQDNYKHQFIDLCYNNGILNKLTFYKNERITNITFIVYNHPEYGTISYSIYYQKGNTPNDFWITKLIDDKHWEVIQRSQSALLDIAEWVTCE